MPDSNDIRNQQRTIWDSVAAGWHRWQPAFDSGASMVSERLVSLAGLAEGQSVIDFGTGLGEPAGTAARVVGPQGTVVGVDVSEEMLRIARAEHAGVQQLSFVAGDVETLALRSHSFDVGLSRWGLMFAADRPSTLSALGRLLRPAGVLAATTWAQPADVPMISLAFRVIAEKLSLSPPPPGPGPFTMSAPDQVEAELAAAGFGDITVERGVVPFRLASTDEYVRFARDVLPPGMKRLLIDRCGSVEDPAIWQAVRQAADAFRVADGSVSMPSTCLYVRAVAPGGMR